VKLHDLAPAPGSTKRRIRVGRGIAAGKGKTAGRGTKGQKSRAGASIPGWFEGGQTPLHVRVPKLRGFKRRDRIEYQVVNVGRISEYAAAGRFGGDASAREPLTVNAQVLAAAGLVSHPDRPVKVLGSGDVTVKVFVAADAFTATARSKIEGAGGFVQVLAPTTAESAAKEASAPSPEPRAEAETTG
jgi:large subunit ribosomal protein L15